MKLVVFTSALNEEETIGKMLDQIPKRIDGITEIEKLVIDDGSTDNTAKVASEHGATVLSNGTQKRLSFSFQRAVDKALRMGADIAVNIDADLQFNPKQIPDMIAPILNDGYDFVAADRFTDRESGNKRRPKNMPVGKYYSNQLGSWIVGKLSGYKFRDVTCGFRAYNRESLLRTNLNTRYTYTQESFQVLAMNRMNITSVPVDVKYFPGRKSRVVQSFFGFLFGSGLNIIRAFRDFAPLSFFGGIGSILLFFGIILNIFTVGHYLMNGTFSPYIFIAFTGVYLDTLGIITWIVGLMADMLDRIRNNQEKILYFQKQEIYKN